MGLESNLGGVVGLDGGRVGGVGTISTSTLSAPDWSCIKMGSDMKVKWEGEHIHPYSK